MSIELLAIKFNHNPKSARTDALNIRKNSKDFVTVPEWVRGMTKPEDSLAAYAIKETKGNTITIQAQFGRTDPNILEAEIRAVQPPPPPPPQWWKKWLKNLLEKYPWLWYVIAWLFYRGFGFNVIGVVKMKKVKFNPNHKTDFEEFELEKLWLWNRGVGIHTIKWQWQYRLKPTDPWANFKISNHKIYTVLEVPKSPWNQTPYKATNTQLPWSEVMDYACQWADSTYNLDDAATRITRSIYKLGETTPPIIEYDCPNSGDTWYINKNTGQFKCSDFLGHLAGKPGFSIYVNCSDCATFVSTFANILGCDLWQSRMLSPQGYGVGFDLNPILAIGSKVWQTACGWGDFNYHEVAWKGGCTSNDEVFDACLQVDGDGDPTANDPSHTPLLPTNMRFGNPGGGQYRDRLARPADRLNCEPMPSERRRREVI